MDKPARNFTDAMKALNDFMSSDVDYRTMPIDEIQKELKNHGIDLNKTIRSVKLTVNRNISVEQLEKARKIRERFLALIASAENKQQNVIDSFNKSRQEIMNQIINFTKNSIGGVPAAYFRNLEQVNDSDLNSLLDDLKKIDQLEDDMNG